MAKTRPIAGMTCNSSGKLPKKITSKGVKMIEVTAFDVPNTPLFVHHRCEDERDTDQVAAYNVSHKWTGYAVLVCGNVPKKKAIAAASAFFSNLPKEFQELLNDTSMSDPIKLQSTIDKLLNESHNKVSIKSQVAIARMHASAALK